MFRLELINTDDDSDSPACWINFVEEVKGGLGEYRNSYKHVFGAVNQRLIKFNGEYCTSHGNDYRVEFETEEDAIAFILRFS